MNPKALKSLEYYKIIDQLTEKASSQMGKDLCRHLLPSEDVYEIRHMQTQTRDASHAFSRKETSPLERKRRARLTENVWKSEVPLEFPNSLPLPDFWKIPTVSKPTPEMSAEMQEKTLWTACLRVWSH